MAAKSNEYSNYLTPQVIRVLKTLQPGEMEPRQQRRRSEPNQVTPLPDNDTFLQDTHAFFFQHFPSPEEIAKIMSPEIFAAVMLAQVSHLIWKKTPSVEDDFKEVYELEKQKKIGQSVSRVIDAELRRIGLLSLPLKIKRIVRAELMGKFDRAAINLMMRITNERYDLTQELTTKLRTQFEQKLSNISENESEIKSLVEEIVEFCNNEMQMLEKTELYYLRRMIVVHALGSVSWREKSLRILNEVQNRFREDKKAE